MNIRAGEFPLAICPIIFYLIRFISTLAFPVLASRSSFVIIQDKSRHQNLIIIIHKNRCWKRHECNHLFKDRGERGEGRGERGEGRGERGGERGEGRGERGEGRGERGEGRGERGEGKKGEEGRRREKKGEEGRRREKKGEASIVQSALLKMLCVLDIYKHCNKNL